MNKDDKNATLKSAIDDLLDPSALDTVLNSAYTSELDSTLHSPRTTLLHVRFNEDQPQIAGLARFLWKQCVNYALSRKRRLAFKKALLEASPADISASADIVRVVREVFIDFNKKYPSRASEVGEVLAYCIAVHHLAASQIAAKMSLKTSSNMPVHGLDGIHATFNNGQLSVYFLESKLSKTANDGAREYAESVSTFIKNEKQYLREYELIGDLSNLDSLEGEARAIALEHFDVVGKPEIQRRERYVGVICYSESKHFANKIAVSDGPIDIHQHHFAQLYSNEGKHHHAAAVKHLSAFGADPNKCIVYFVAVPDVNVLREFFYEELGIGDAISKQQLNDKKKK